MKQNKIVFVSLNCFFFLVTSGAGFRLIDRDKVLLDKLENVHFSYDFRIADGNLETLGNDGKRGAEHVGEVLGTKDLNARVFYVRHIGDHLFAHCVEKSCQELKQIDFACSKLEVNKSTI